MPELTWLEECGFCWDTPDVNDHHVCVKPFGHTADITNDDHRCCCGTTSEGDVHA